MPESDLLLERCVMKIAVCTETVREAFDRAREVGEILSKPDNDLGSMRCETLVFTRDSAVTFMSERASIPDGFQCDIAVGFPHYKLCRIQAGTVIKETLSNEEITDLVIKYEK